MTILEQRSQGDLSGKVRMNSTLWFSKGKGVVLELNEVLSINKVDLSKLDSPSQDPLLSPTRIEVWDIMFAEPMSILSSHALQQLSL